jgi:hypothetical protein
MSEYSEEKLDDLSSDGSSGPVVRFNKVNEVLVLVSRFSTELVSGSAGAKLFLRERRPLCVRENALPADSSYWSRQNFRRVARYGSRRSFCK